MYQSIAICFNPFVLGLENVEHIHICTCIQNIELITHPWLYRFLIPTEEDISENKVCHNDKYQ